MTSTTPALISTPFRSPSTRSRATPARTGGKAWDTSDSASERHDWVQERIGSEIADKYRLDALLGVGGTAAVYRATHRNGARVAVKILHRHVGIDSSARARFLREGYVANKIHHPGVVRVLDDFSLEDEAFLVMDLLEGAPLDRYSRDRGGALHPEEVTDLAIDVLDLLVAAHAKAIVHRDIKPSNLFLTTDGAVKVLDFGIARLHEPESFSQTRTGVLMGTPAFMAPEQALGQTREVDGQTDVWAVGATMFTLLTGEYVHDAATAEAARVYAGSRPARRLSTVAKGVDAALARVVDRALSFDKHSRWPSAAAMREALLALREGGTLDATGLPVQVSSLTTTPALAKPSRRARALIGTGVAVAVTLGAAALLAARVAPSDPARGLPASVSEAPTYAAAPRSRVEVFRDLSVAQVEKAEPAPTTTSRAQPAQPPGPRAHAAAVPHHPEVRRESQPPPASGADPALNRCDPPYTVDVSNHHIYKPECLPDSVGGGTTTSSAPQLRSN